MRSPIRVLFILVAGAAIVAGGGRPRPAFAIDGATQWSGNGHWYKLVTSTSPLKWTDCKAAAEALGGYLATLTSAAEDQWVIANIAPAWSSSYPIGWTYIGGTDAAKEGTWTWVTGEPWSYTHWDNQNPSNSGGNENYLHTQSHIGVGQWNDIADINGSYAVNNYIVEWDSGSGGPPPPTSLPAAPSNLAGSVSPGNPIALTWKDNSDNEAGFEVERKTDTTAFLREATTGPNATAYDDGATVPSTVYTYRVRAVNSLGSSDYTNEVTIAASALAPAPKAPSDLIVVSVTRDAVDLSWTDNSTNEVGFEVDRRSGTGAWAFIARPRPTPGRSSRRACRPTRTSSTACGPSPRTGPRSSWRSRRRRCPPSR